MVAARDRGNSSGRPEGLQGVALGGGHCVARTADYGVARGRTQRAYQPAAAARISTYHRLSHR